MTARAMWKATLELGDVRVPVKLYAAVADRDVRFRLLHAKDRAPVKQRMVDPRSGREVPADAVQRGVLVEPGVFVIMKDAELEKLGASPTRSIEVMQCVPAEAIDYAWYSRPYFLGPDGSASEYAALVEALGESGLRGIARWTMRGRRYFGALEARASHLALIALRPAEEVVSARQLRAPELGSVSSVERTLARQLVGALEAAFDPGELRDEYRERVLAFVAAKAKGKRLHVVREALPKASASNLARTLKQSLQSVKGKRHAA